MILQLYMSFLIILSFFISQLRLAVIEAVGPMTHIMNRDQLEEQLPKLLHGILGLYKKHHVSFYVTQVSTLDNNLSLVGSNP